MHWGYVNRSNLFWTVVALRRSFEIYGTAKYGWATLLLGPYITVMNDGVLRALPINSHCSAVISSANTNSFEEKTRDESGLITSIVMSVRSVTTTSSANKPWPTPLYPEHKERAYCEEKKAQIAL